MRLRLIFVALPAGRLHRRVRERQPQHRRDQRQRQLELELELEQREHHHHDDQQQQFDRRCPAPGKPAVMIGDKNYTEQFVLGQLYLQALAAKGFTVSINRNIGPTEVTIQALATGRLAMYPEYLKTWNTQIAGNTRIYRSAFLRLPGGAALRAHARVRAAGPDAVQRHRRDRGHGRATRRRTASSRSGTCASVGQTLTLGAPPQLQQGPGARCRRSRARTASRRRRSSRSRSADQYPALDSGSVQAAYVNTTDGQLASGDYRCSRTRAMCSAGGNVVPVVSEQALNAEGPAFAEIDQPRQLRC